MSRVYFSNGVVVEGTKGGVKRAIKAHLKYFPGIKYRFSEPFCVGACSECPRNISTGWGFSYCDYKDV